MLYYLTPVVLCCRTVADEQRTLALGVQSLAFRVIGSIPGPLIFGAILDSTCVLWQYECGSRGNCWEYANSTLTLRFFLIGFLTNVVNTICIFLGWLWYGRNWCFRKVPNKNTAKVESRDALQSKQEHSDSSSGEDHGETEKVKANGQTGVFPKLPHEVELVDIGHETSF